MNSSKIEKSSKKLPWLAGLLGIQLVAAVILFNVQNRAPTANDQPLLAFDKTSIDGIEIVAGEEKIELHKKDGKWQIGEDLPVAQTRIDDLLKELEALRGGWAVATTREAAKRFEVTDDKFKRKVRLLQGDKEIGALVVGTSPTFRQSHVRKVGDDSIYSAKLAEFSLPTEKDTWLDAQLMRPAGDIVALEFAGSKVEKVAGHWPTNQQAAAPGAAAPGEPSTGTTSVGETTAAAPVQVPAEGAVVAEADKPAPSSAPGFDSAAFAKALGDITVLGIALNQAELDAPVTADAKTQDGNKVLKIEWKVTTDKGAFEYQLLSKNDQYYIRRGDNDHTFRLSKAQYDALAKIQELRQS